MSFDKIKSFYKEFNCELISKQDEYKNNTSKLKFKCHCGHESIKTYKCFTKTKQCKECGDKQRIKSNALSFDVVKTYFTSQKCILLSNETDFENRDSKLKYICECNNESIISYHNFKNGKRCKECYKIRVNLNSYDKTKELFNKNKCVLLTEYSNDWDINDKQKFKCSCNNEDYITPLLLKKQSKTKKPYLGFCITCKSKKQSDSAKKMWVDHRTTILNGIKNIDQESKMIKLKKTNLERYGVENAMQNESIKDKVKETNLERYGFEYGFQNEDIKEKTKKTNLERYGVEYIVQNKDIKDKINQTILYRYGVEYISQNESIKDKVKETNLERYGVENAMQNESIKDKVKETNLERYGVEYAMQNESIKDKVKKTNLERYGVENAMQNESIKDKVKETNLERYGVEYAIQNIDVFKKCREKYKQEYKFPNGRVEYVEGYENIAIDLLLLKYDEDDIVIDDGLIPEIWYKVDGKQKRYYGDIYIKSKNLIIEVKSEYIYKYTKDATEIKRQAVLDNNYSFELIII